MGRPRKPLERHLLEGSYRADRHGPLPAISQETLPMEPKTEYLFPHIDMEPVDKMLVSAESLAKLFDVSRSTVRLWEKNGDMPAGLRIAGCTRWEADEIRRWIRAGCPDRDGETNGMEL